MTQSSAGGEPLRVLLVEDHAMVAQLMMAMLAELGHRPTHAASVGAALTAVGQAPFDVLLCDYRLPDGSGADLVRQLPPGCSAKAVLLTAHDREALGGGQAGFHCVLEKPVDMDQLESVLEQLRPSRTV